MLIYSTTITKAIGLDDQGDNSVQESAADGETKHRAGKGPHLMVTCVRLESPPTLPHRNMPSYILGTSDRTWPSDQQTAEESYQPFHTTLHYGEVAMGIWT